MSKWVLCIWANVTARNTHKDSTQVAHPVQNVREFSTTNLSIWECGAMPLDNVKEHDENSVHSFLLHLVPFLGPLKFKNGVFVWGL